MIHFKELTYGFEYGAAKIQRMGSEEKYGWVALIIITPKYPKAIQIYVTKTGKVRIHDERGEWTPPEGKKKR